MAGERGRPRSFDTGAALEQALHVFWKHGFQDASMHELTEAMGLSKPSLYAAFGDKEALYLKALERYAALLLERHGRAMQEQKSGKQALAAFLRSMAAMLADPALPGGCFIITGAADCGGSTTPAAVETALRAALGRSEQWIAERIALACQDGELAPDTDVQALAAMFMAVIAGMAVMAKGGASESKLVTIIDAAMAAWPVSKHASRRA